MAILSFKRCLAFLVVFMYALGAKNQSINEIDSIKQVAEKMNPDTQCIEAHLSLSAHYHSNDYDLMADYANSALELITEALKRKVANPKELSVLNNQLARSYNLIAFSFHGLGDLPAAKNYYENSLRQFELNNDSSGQSSAWNNLGYLMSDIGKKEEAIDFYKKAVAIREKLGDKKALANTINNIGLLYLAINDFESALNYFQITLKLREEAGDFKGIALSYHNLAQTYGNLGDQALQVSYHLNALRIREKNDDFIGIASSLRELGAVYFERKDYDRAEESYERALQIYRQVGDLRGTILIRNFMAELFLEQNRFAQAFEYTMESYQDAVKLDLKELIKRTSLTTYKVCKQKGDLPAALAAYEMYVETKDSLSNEKYNQLLAQMKVQKAIDEQSAKDRAIIAAQEEQIKLKSFQTNMMYAGIAVLAFFLLFVFNRLKITHKQKRIIETQQHEMQLRNIENEAQKKLVERKNSEIMDSIRYARKIQNAILPSMERIKTKFPDSFLFYQAKDIVAGDFYWLAQRDDYIYFALADCTGHGVPGAMMSVVCHNALDKALNVYNCISAADLLYQTRNLVIDEFSKTNENEITDGMDISLFRVDNNSKQLIWAGANSSLIVSKNGVLNEIKGNKQPIGKFISDNRYDEFILNFESFDTIYLFTDGIKDQFGGSLNKKLKMSGLKDFIANHTCTSLEEQEQMLRKFFVEWKGDNEQIDDVCMAAFQFK